MKVKLLSTLKRTIEWLEAIYFKYSLESLDNSAYFSLSPIDNSDEGGHYSTALLWALTNRKKEDIKNIALTGPYGSGKSSILKTFQKNYKGDDLKFLNISLATFKEEKVKLDEKGNEIEVDKSNLLRLIEVSILEQIFYHEEDNKIPDSRFKKIKSYSFKKLFITSLGYLILLLAVYIFSNPSFIQSIFKNSPLSETLCNWIYIGCILISLIGIFIVIYNSVRIISTITINNLKFQNAEIGVGDKLNKSVLNHHIDEILYFFSIRPYNVVIIEDLDRFRETEIFTKLREVNLLLNSSEKTKRKEIVFVYAVRDDMFTDKERTKFFDFIIPVIPVINSSNSSEILLKKKNEFDYKLSDNLVEDISLFIDDMRLLHNISNEFYLYKEQLDKGLNHDKLFAIITYKNIYPNDFMKLSRNEGELFNIINSKSKFVQTKITSIETTIESIKLKIYQLENLSIKNIVDLRRIYLFEIINKLTGIMSLIINDKSITFKEATEDKNFEYIKKDKFKYNQCQNSPHYGPSIKVIVTLSYNGFKTIEELVDKNKSYEEYESEIKESKIGKIQDLRNEILNLEKEKNKTKNLKLSALLKSNQFPEFTVSKNSNHSFIYILLRNGYIAEDYIEYISLFHEESITRSDYQFHINIKNEICLPYDHKLFKIDKLLPKININDFDSEYVLNYDLLDYLLKNSNSYKEHLNLIFNKLKDESKVSVEFIMGYFLITPNLQFFVKILCRYWSNIWNFIEKNPSIEEKTKRAIFTSIIEHAEIDSIKAISVQPNFIKTIISNKYFLSITEDHQKLKAVINEFKLKFESIDFDLSPKELIEFIYKNDYYKINIEFITSLIKSYGVFNQIEFDNSNYSFIRESKANELIKYIEKYINEYVLNCYLKIETNIYEKEKYLIELLNNEDLDFKNKELIIERVQTKITNLSSITDVKLFPLLLKNNRVTPKWENLLHDFNNYVLEEENEEEIQDSEKSISDSTIQYISIIENADELSKVKIPIEVNAKNIYDIFWEKVLQCNQIADEAYALIIKSSPWWYDTLELANLSESKVLSLINNSCLEPKLTNFNSLKKSFNGLNIRFLEERKTEFFKILEELTFDKVDLQLVLKSNFLNKVEKLKVLNRCSENTIMNYDNLSLIVPILLDETSISSVNETIIPKILKYKYFSAFHKIKLFNKEYLNYDAEFIELFLSSMIEDEYLSITNRSTKTKLNKNEENRLFLEILVRVNFISSYSERGNHYQVNHKRIKE